MTAAMLLGAAGHRAGASTASTPVPILVTDDNPAKRMALKAVLTPLGYPIVEADSGLAALRCVMEQDFAVILLDVCMPTMDGFETAALIRQRQQSEMTPIIFITAFGSDEIVHADRYAEGAVDFIFAPVEPEVLRAKVSVFANLFAKAEILATQAREVQASADQLRLLTDAAPIGIFQTDTYNRYVYTNPRWSEITGIPPEEASGGEWEMIIDAEHRPALLAKLGDGAVDRAEFSHRFEILRPGATSRVVLLTSVPIPNTNAGIAGWVGTVADVTVEAEAEAAMSKARDEATQASRLKSDFLANMSHEIRTPMNGVIGMADLLLDTDLDPRQHDYAQTVRNSGEALLSIINDILDFSKVEAGKLELEHIEFSIRAIVDDVADLLASPADTKGLDLIAAVGSSVPSIVNGDPGRLRQVLTNLVGNAIKFSEAGEVIVRVAQTDVSGNESIVRFEISDTGDGIAPDKLEEIFQPFVQADSSTSRKYGGTGLGLAISSQLVALMGGDCGVSSEPGVGSTFWFTICVAADPEALSQRPPSSTGLGGVRALVADDNATQRAVLSEYLTEWGMDVTTADSASAAIELMGAPASKDEGFGVLLLDGSMSGMVGPALRAVLEDHPRHAARLVLMGASREEADLDDVVEPALCTFLPKPVHADNLLACVRLVLGLDPAVAAQKTLRSSLAGGPEMGRLLLAEDNFINQKVAVAMLSGAGYRVDTVPNGAEAVQAAALHLYDAILMDCQMPVMDGYEATAAIRAGEGPRSRTPIIALTASARREDRDRCLAAGMDSYLSKPLGKDALLALLAESVKKRSTGSKAPLSVRRTPLAEITLDPSTFDRLRALGGPGEENFLSELVSRFLEDTERQLLQLEQALVAGNAPEVGRIAHSIQGSGGQLGGRRLALYCRRLEGKARAGCALDVQTDLNEVATAYRDLRESLTQQVAAAEEPVGLACE